MAAAGTERRYEFLKECYHGLTLLSSGSSEYLLDICLYIHSNVKKKIKEEEEEEEKEIIE